MEDYYLFAYEFNKPYMKLVAVSTGMFLGLFYLRLLEYRKATREEQKTKFKLLHFTANSKLTTVALYVYAIGMMLFVTSIALTANKDAYSWTTAQNVSYYSFGRLGYCSSVMAFLTIIFLDKGELIKRLLGQPLWVPFAKLAFPAYLIYPMVIGL